MKTPACNHWASVRDRYAAVWNFLEWAEAEHGLALDWRHAKPDCPTNLHRLICVYLDVDTVALERERAALTEEAACLAARQQEGVSP